MLEIICYDTIPLKTMFKRNEELFMFDFEENVIHVFNGSLVDSQIHYWFDVCYVIRKKNITGYLAIEKVFQQFKIADEEIPTIRVKLTT